MRRKWAALVVLVVAAAAAILVAVSVAGTEAGAWRELSPPPLSPRETPAGFWTGEEVVLVGGSDAPPCPPNADCEAPSEPPLADGAAYHPAADSWRSIPDAPVAFSWAQPVVLDTSAYLWIGGEPGRPEAPSAFLAYRIEDDRWEELELPTDEPDWYLLAEAGDQLVAVSMSDEDGQARPDFLFDPATSAWSELPDDPLSPGFDRLAYWDGAEVLLFDHELTDDFEDLPLRGAAYDPGAGTWRLLDDPDAAYETVGPEEPADAGGPPFESEPLYGGTTGVEAGDRLFTFLGSTWPEGDEDGELHARAWLWSPDS